MYHHIPLLLVNVTLYIRAADYREHTHQHRANEN
jgi:hypothetical protein